MPPVSSIGRSLPRLDGAEKASGLTRFAADIAQAGTLHARLVLSHHAHARIVKVDARAAEAVPGVVRVLTGRDLPLGKQDPSDRNRCPLALDDVRFVGHPVAAVVALSEAVAEDAAALVVVEYEVLPASVDALDAMRPDAPVVREPGSEGDEAELGQHGAAGGGGTLKEALPPNVASTQHFPRAALASVDALGTVTVWSATQALFYTRSEVAEALGLSEHQVRIVATPLGGGFGGKFVLLEPLAAALALAVKRPVSLVLTRTEEFLMTTPAPASLFELKTGVAKDGTLTALDARVIFDAGAYAGAPVGIACLMLGSCYRLPHMEIRGYEVLTHKPGNGAYRAPGAVQAAFALESQMDDMARALGLDPLDFRLRNASGEGDLMPNGNKWPRIGLRPCLEKLKEERDRRTASPPSHPRFKRGVGVALGGWMGGVEPANAVCRLERDGTLSIIVGTVDMSGTNTALAQIAAESFGLDAGLIRVVNADTEAAPYAGSSGGSKITYTVGAAVEKAARDARQQLFAIAAKHLEAAVEDLELVDRAIQVRGAPGKAVPIAQLAKASMQFGGKYEPVYGRGSTATIARAPAFAAHLAEVEVDTETGYVRVLDQVVVQDVGRALNPAAIEGQIQGAAAQGLGWALLERMPYDAHGQLLSATFMDYAMPASETVAAVRAVFVEVPSEHGPFGAKGVGEPPVVAAPAAIANAVMDAAGRRFTELPITSEAVRRALGGEFHP